MGDNSSADTLTLANVLEADVRELRKISLIFSDQNPLQVYTNALISYLKGDLLELEKNLFESSELQEGEHVKELIKIRLAIRKNQEIDKEFYQKQMPSELWNAEYLFVLAMWNEVCGNDSIAKDFYLKAQKGFFKNGALRKAAKSYHNALACLSRIEPNIRLVTEYQEAAALAKEAGDNITEAAALNNLSREFQLMKAHRAALQYANDAILLLRRSAYGSYNFYASLCHRCQIHLELEQYGEAALDFEEACASKFPEITQSLSVLRTWFQNLGLKVSSASELESRSSSYPDSILPSWRERLSSGVMTTKDLLTAQENQVLEILTHGPQDKFELIEKLWGTEESFFDLENRLKQLLYRLRKKRPDLINFQDGKYILVENVHRLNLGEMGKKKSPT